MAKMNDDTRRPPSRTGRVQVTAHVDAEVRKLLKVLAMQRDVTLQHLLCVAINDLLEKSGFPRLADEAMLPRGGGGAAQAQKKRTFQRPSRNPSHLNKHGLGSMLGFQRA